MPKEPYITVTLRKEVIAKLRAINPNDSISKLVTMAIADYIEKANPKAFKPFDSVAWILRHTSSSNCGDIRLFSSGQPLDLRKR